MFILNVIIVLFYVAVIAITTKYIIGNDLARSFLDKVMYMPTAPVYIISGSVGLLQLQLRSLSDGAARP